jgi:IclR family KDG regulon transcriptional repressor
VASEGISSVERALRLMEALLNGPETVTVLANKLGIGKATAFRLAQTLKANDYVVQLDDSRYQLGPRCMALAATAAGNIDARRDLRWALEELNHRTSETALLSVLAGRDAVCIDSITSKQAVVSVATVGEIWPAHTCSAGLAFLADDESFAERYLAGPLAQNTATTVHSPDLLHQMLEQTRIRGYSVNTSYFRDGVCAVGALVHDARGQAVAALSVMMPEFRFRESGADHFAAAVTDVCRRASILLGWRESSPP